MASTDREVAFLAAMAGITAAFASVITSVIAFFVYLEARNIRKMEWFSKTAQNWQDFNSMIMEADNHGRWSKIISGEAVWGDLDQRDRMMIYSFLNVLVFEYSARKRALLEKSYADRSIQKNILYLKSIWHDLRYHLIDDGWPLQFVYAADGFVNHDGKKNSQLSL